MRGITFLNYRSWAKYIANVISSHVWTLNSLISKNKTILENIRITNIVSTVQNFDNLGDKYGQ